MNDNMLIDEIYKVFNVKKKDAVSHDDCMGLREHFMSLYPKDAVNVMPYVLVDILKNPEDKFSIGIFVDFLNGHMIDDNEINEESLQLQSWKNEMFSPYNSKQSFIIYKCLRWIDKNVFHGVTLCAIESASTYWYDKSHATVGGHGVTAENIDKTAKDTENKK